MSTSNKLTYLNETKQELKQAINNIGGEVTDETTFRQYVSQLENVYDNLPKTEFQEGTEVTIEGGLKGKLDFEDGIVGIGDTSQKSYQGYQMIDTNETIAETTRNGVTYSLKNGVFTFNGTATDNISIYLNNKVTLKSGTYSFGPKDTSGSYTGIFGKYPNVASTGNVFDGGHVRSCVNATINSDYSNVRLYLFIANGAVFTNYSFKLLLIQGTYTESNLPNYEPYVGGTASPNPSYPQPIKSVTGNQEIVESGKNKVDFNEWLNTLMTRNPNINSGSIDSYTNNSITITSKGNDCFTNSYTISNNATINKSFCETYPNLVQEIKGNTKYTISYNRSNTSLIARPCFFYLDENYNYLGLAEDRTATDVAIFTSPSNAKYLTFRFGIYSSTGSTLTISNLMIEENPTATTYEPYHTPITYPISLGDIELCKIGNYADELLYDVENDKVYKNKAINKKIIDGTEGWQDSGITSVAYTNIITDYATSNNIPYCTHFKGENNCNGAGGMQDYGDNSIAFMQVSGSITPRLYIKKIGMTTTQLRTLLAEIKPILYYALETEVKEEITGTLKDQIKALYNSQSFTGTTILESNGDLPMIIKVRALKGE